jgi:tetratricopeptide (TPR) repeat protein
MKHWMAAASVGLAGFAWGQGVPPKASAERISTIMDQAATQMWQYTDRYWHAGEHVHMMWLEYLIVEMDPTFVNAFSGLAWLLDSYGYDAEAVRVYNRSIAQNPRSWEAYYELGFYYYNNKLYADAKPYLQKATENSPTLANPHRLLAHACERLGQYEESLRAWDAVLKMAPGDPAATANRERVKKLLEDKKAAGGQ